MENNWYDEQVEKARNNFSELCKNMLNEWFAETHDNIMKKYGQETLANGKPPEGIIPMWLHNEHRLQELNNAIERYNAAEKEVPQEWIDEKYILDSYFANREAQSSIKATDDVRERITAFRFKDTGAIYKHDSQLKNQYCQIDGKAPFYPLGYFLISLNSFEIYSALSKDNVEFKIGDAVNGRDDQIKGFEIQGDYIMAVFGNNSAHDVEAWRERINLDSLTKAEEKKVLLTIEGKKFYENDMVPFVVDFENTGDAIFDEWTLGKRDPERNLQFFLTKEAAEKWIAHNQKSISFQDLVDYVVESVGDKNTKEFPMYSEINATLLLNHFTPKKSATK